MLLNRGVYGADTLGKGSTAQTVKTVIGRDNFYNRQRRTFRPRENRLDIFYRCGHSLFSNAFGAAPDSQCVEWKCRSVCTARQVYLVEPHCIAYLSRQRRSS